MFCCSRKTLFILLGVAGVFGLLIATGTVNAYAILPFLPFLLCPLMCVAMMMFGRKCDDGSCEKKPGTKSTASKT
jgi:uncharacterized protein YbcC (UPF0753/DUF2309 family)